MSKITLGLLDDNYCPLTSTDCEDMSDSFSYSQAILVVKDNNQIVSCLGYSNPYKDVIHIDGTCTKTSSRGKGYNTLLRVLLFMMAKKNNFKYITASSNNKSMPLMTGVLNATCNEEEYFKECNWECNCLVKIEDEKTIKHVEGKLVKLLKNINFRNSLLSLLIYDWSFDRKTFTPSKRRSTSKRSATFSKSKKRTRKRRTRSAPSIY